MHIAASPGPTPTLARYIHAHDARQRPRVRRALMTMRASRVDDRVRGACAHIRGCPSHVMNRALCVRHIEYCINQFALWLCVRYVVIDCELCT